MALQPGSGVVLSLLSRKSSLPPHRTHLPFAMSPPLLSTFHAHVLSRAAIGPHTFRSLSKPWFIHLPPCTGRIAMLGLIALVAVAAATGQDILSTIDQGLGGLLLKA